MAGSDEDRGLAAEYVLGTLDTNERAAFEARLAGDAALADEVARWQLRLSFLDEETPDAEPLPATYAKILARIDTPDMNNVVQLRRRVAIWRNAAIAVSAIAAALILFVVGAEWSTPKKSLYVAVLQGEGTSPAFVAAVDLKSKLIVVRRLGRRAPADKSYELWALGAGRATPQPLGVVDAAVRIPSERLGTLDGTTLAVSLEPEGGSPTGLPTGPVLFTGKLLSTE